jgi:hypothetical protein
MNTNCPECNRLLNDALKSHTAMLGRIYRPTTTPLCERSWNRTFVWRRVSARIFGGPSIILSGVARFLDGLSAPQLFYETSQVWIAVFVGIEKVEDREIMNVATEALDIFQFVLSTRPVRQDVVELSVHR